MKCVICNRELKNPPLTVGAYAIGPVCAKKRGLVQTKTKTKAKKAQRDDRTLDLFNQGE